MKLIKRITAIAVGLSLMNITACGTQTGEGVRTADLSLSADSIVKSSGISATVTDYSPKALFKAKQELESPLLTNIFCADPTAVEYNGRLYVYGTNDNQQYLEKSDSDNTYECIKSFVIISTDDMVNWRFEGIIDTATIAPRIMASWAPSVTSRVEEDGLTHFYLYFSHSGAGVGGLTATDPAGLGATRSANRLSTREWRVLPTARTRLTRACVLTTTELAGLLSAEVGRATAPTISPTR